MRRPYVFITIVPVVVACGGSASRDAPTSNGSGAAGAGGSSSAGGAAATGRCGFPTALVRDAGNPLTTVEGTPLHPCGAIGDPFVLYDSTRAIYRMWYTGFAKYGPLAANDMRLGIAYAESADGLRWDAPVDTELCMGAPDDANWIDLSVIPEPTSWNPHGVETSTVTQAADGSYIMLYTGNLPDPPGLVSNATSIGAATSPDGVTWTQQPAPVLDAEQQWEQPFEIDGFLLGGTVEPSILWDEAEAVFKLWYSAIGRTDPADADSWGSRIGYATSTDGLDWMRRPEPVLEPVPNSWESRLVGHTHVIADPASGYHLFYIGSTDADFACTDCFYPRASIGHAYSEDGISWQRNPHNPLLTPDEESFDGHMVFGPSGLIKDGRIMLWYFASVLGTTDGAAKFGLATADCPGGG